MRALLAGFGGIGKNVYYPELQNLGYEIDILDSMSSSATYADISDVKGKYDLGVICTPNYTHARIASALVDLCTTDIFVEKPGVGSADEWIDLSEHSRSRIHLVKNNLYRADYGNIVDLMNEGTVIGVDINWLNNNRIPNPGNWFTNKAYAISGVSGDLMPHLYCFAVHLFGEQVITESKFEQSSYTRWDLKNIKSTDYGVIDPAGVYDVDDCATARTVVNNIPLRLTASWKEGYDKQSITLFFEDGTTYEWSFGLCPAEAYGTMLKDLTVSTRVDTAIHRFLEGFNK